MNRALFILRLVCFGGAAILLALAIASGSVPVSGTALAIIGAAVLIFAGAAAGTLYTEEHDRLRTEHDRAELLSAELNEHRASVDVLADGLDVAIFICGPKASVMYANRKAVEMFHFDDPIGRSVLAVTLSYDLEQMVVQSLAGASANHKEVVFTYPAERVGLVDVWTDSGRAFLSIQDITDLRRLERVRQDFVANVSHELRTPLTSIRAMAETIQEEPDTPKETQERYLSRITEEVDRLSLIANDLLILSVAESNPVRKQACDIADVVRRCVYQLEKKANQKGLKLAYDGPPSLLIEANPAQMSQVVLNLVDNALNYTPGGSVTASLSQHNQVARLDIADTGIGIASEHLPRVFERFYRVDKGRSRATGGTGLGLSIVKHIVEAHGGTVSVQSALNQGSTFTVTLPMGD